MRTANPLALPLGWVETTLAEVVEPRIGKSDPQARPEARYIGMDQVEAHSMRLLGTREAGSMKSVANVFRGRDVLYGRLRPYLNKVYQPDFDGMCSSEFIVMPETSAVCGNFLKYRMNSGDFVKFSNGLNTGDRPRVDFSQIGDFEFSLPPRDEQSRIAGTLDELFSDLDAGVVALERARDKLTLYRASALKAAVEGTLTADWRAHHRQVEPANELLKRILVERRRRWEQDQLRQFEEKGRVPPKNWKAKYKEPAARDTTRLPDLPDGWCWVSWGQVGFSQNGRAFPSKHYQGSGTKLLRPGNLHVDGQVRWTEKNTRYMPDRYLETASALVVGPGELVINLTAQSLKDDFLGRVCITSRDELCLLNQRLARLTPIVVPPRFMLWVFKSAVFRQFVSELNTGSLIQHMFTRQLDEFLFPLPPLPEQEAIAEIVDDRLSVIERLEADIDGKLKKARGLRQAILRRAFTGKLVPQDSNDEPATELLKRVAAERETRAREAQTAQRSRPRSRRRST